MNYINKIKFFRNILLCTAFLIFGCDRGRKGLMSQPDAGITSISGAIAMMDKANYPYTDVYAKILDNNGNAITDLKLGNINITEDNKPAVALDIEETLSPLSIVLILDRSGSMGEDGTMGLNNAAVGFVDALSIRDFVEVVDFGTTIKVSQSFTNDKDKLKETIRSGTYDMGATALFDAVGKAIDDIQQVGGTKVIIAMTDGANNASIKYTLTSLIAYAVSKNQNINTIGYGSVYSSASLIQIANDTGGTFSSASTASELYDAYQEMVPVPVVDHVKVKFRSLSKKAEDIAMYVMYGQLNCSFRLDYPETTD